MRVLFFLDPKGYTIKVTQPGNLVEVESADLDEPIANNDVEDAVLDAPAEDVDVVVIENPAFDPAAHERDDIDGMFGIENAVLHAPVVYGIPNYDAIFANNVDEDIPEPHDNVEDAVLDAPIAEN
ncbi:hypothetical protein TNCV_3022571 [Trichonephila clavipes]|nr:hypothetical protein TNCV_3022571 [Trichonephila clavipes]